MIPATSHPAPEAPGPAFKRRGHIVLNLLAVLVSVGVVPLALMAWWMIGVNRESLTTAQQELQQLVASSMAHELDLHVEGLRSELLRVAQTLGAAVRRRGTIPVEEIRRVIEEIEDERLRNVRYAYFENQEVRSVSAGELPHELEPLFTASLQRVAEDQSTAAGGLPSQTICSDPILIGSDRKRAILVVAAPVVVSGSFRGVLTGLVDLQNVWDIVARSKHTGHLVFALDELGTVFASNDPEGMPAGQSLRGTEIVERFLAGDSRARVTMPFTLSRHGAQQHYIGTFDSTGQRWGIFVQARDQEIYWPVRDMEHSTVTLALALFGVAGLAAMFFARSLSNPINSLAAASRALADRDFSVRVPVRSGNEIGELAYTFNSMAAGIQSYICRLRAANEENSELFRGTIRALAEAIDAKDPYTRGHSDRVNNYSRIIGRELGLSDNEMFELDVSSLLHDVGKIGIEDSILRKTEPLTESEFSTIKTHPVLGADIMAPIAQMKNMIPGLRHHHERCNGMGYPDGLTREQIPLMARIIAVADTFDAITTNRPYQQRMSFEAAVARINDLKGQSLDTKVVEAFNRAYRANQILHEVESAPARGEGDILAASASSAI